MENKCYIYNNSGIEILDFGIEAENRFYSMLLLEKRYRREAEEKMKNNNNIIKKILKKIGGNFYGKYRSL